MEISISKLKQEKNFIKYLKLLTLFAKRYTVFIAACDTPCGLEFSSEAAHALMNVGIKTNMVGMFRHSYAAIIDAGELIFESIAPSVTEPVKHETVINGNLINIESVCFDVPQSSTAKIVINGKNYSPDRRGLNFVVFDMVTGTLLDAVKFDTCNKSFPYNRPNEIIEGLIDYEKSHPEVSVLCFTTPILPESDLSDNEKAILKDSIRSELILENLDKPISVLNQYFSPKEIAETLTPPKSYYDIHCVRKFEDTCGKCVNTSGGQRVTIDQPYDYNRTVYIVGGCQVFGVGSSDKGTITSHLQRLFNEIAPEQRIIVQNYGYYLWEMEDAETTEELNAVQTVEELEILKSLPVKPGDIVLCKFGINSNIPFVDMGETANRPHNYGEVFFDKWHYTEDGNRMIADQLFEYLKEKNFFFQAKVSPRNSHIPLSSSKNASHNFNDDMKSELEEYKNKLVGIYDSMIKTTIGCVVVNCNPFTLGHRYLIEWAAKQVNYLMVFVVQEDKSIFPFDDRLKLVTDGVADLKNVIVIPSGNFIISSLTFSEYFNKTELQDRVIDSTLDVTLFAQEIAPCLNISVRFVGEEPFDKVTKQYNDTLRNILPLYGIKLIEIPRKEYNGEEISASRVRKLLYEKKFNEIEKIVPKTTLTYLLTFDI